MLMPAGYSLDNGTLACQIFKAQKMAGLRVTRALTDHVMWLFALQLMMLE
jgi:hypothetical protein